MPKVPSLESQITIVPKKGYESLSRDTIQSIGCATAIGLWAWSISQPKGWIIREKHVRKELNIGEVRYRKARKRLAKLGLWEVIRTRGEKGEIVSSRIQLNGDINPELLKSSQLGKTRALDSSTSQETSQPLKVESLKEPETSTVEQIFKKKKIQNTNKLKNKPAAGGLSQTVKSPEEKLTFATQFGVVFPGLLKPIMDEERAVKIALRLGSNDTGMIRMLLGELVAFSINNTVNDIYAAWVKLLRTRDQVTHSKLGEENLPPFA